MSNFESFDRKSFRKDKIESKKKNRKSNQDGFSNEEYKYSKISKHNLKKRLEEMEEEEKWEDWQDEVY